MSRKAIFAILCFPTMLNVIALAVNVSLPSRAATLSYQDLINDPDFIRAVKSIAEQCRVNVDIGKLQC